MTGTHRRPSRWLPAVVGGAVGALLAVAVVVLALVVAGPSLARSIVGPVEPVAAMTIWDDDDARGAMRCEQWLQPYRPGGAVCQVRPIEQAPDRGQAEAGQDRWTARYGAVLGY